MVAPEPDTPPDVDTIRRHLRRGAARKDMQAARIAVLLLSDMSNEQARREMRLTVGIYRKARAWLRSAVSEARLSPDLLTLHEALLVYADRYVDMVVRVGVLHEAGCDRSEVMTRLGITRDQYEVAWEWYRDAANDATDES